MPPLTLFSLSTSRSIRISWLLEELSLPYKLIRTPRDPNTGLSSAEFKARTKSSTGKAPTLHDGDLIIQESGAITEYLCKKYDGVGRLGLGVGLYGRRSDGQGEKAGEEEEEKRVTKVREFVHAAEGTMMMHALPFIYARRVNKEAAEELKPGLQALVRKDLDWLEGELEGV